ncbi:DUF4215 domain-containing protein [Candidatus Woesearchaeota archaeon]|jgi:cysteine-rich repeat protein|nr:DUF4215 domain-containing protein [Candidatus Woesearchaeota archaeon]
MTEKRRGLVLAVMLLSIIILLSAGVFAEGTCEFHGLYFYDKPTDSEVTSMKYMLVNTAGTDITPATLIQIDEFLKYAGKEIYLYSSASIEGSKWYNKLLSGRRSKAIAKYIEKIAPGTNVHYSDTTYWGWKERGETDYWAPMSPAEIDFYSKKRRKSLKIADAKLILNRRFILSDHELFDPATGWNSFSKSTPNTLYITGCAGYNPCGNEKLDPGEECDDGNLIDGDGCNSKCQKEKPKVECGNGIIETGEECDDGNKVGGDGCSAKCTLESCPTTAMCLPASECDKKDIFPNPAQALYNKYCENTKEEGYLCCAKNNTPILAECGNGIREAGEDCDDGNLDEFDGCTTTCVFGSGCTCPFFSILRFFGLEIASPCDSLFYKILLCWLPFLLLLFLPVPFFRRRIKFMNRNSLVHDGPQDCQELREFLTNTIKLKEGIALKIKEINQNIDKLSAESLAEFKKGLNDLAFLYDSDSDDYKNLATSTKDYEQILALYLDIVHMLLALEAKENRLLEILKEIEEGKWEHCGLDLERKKEVIAELKPIIMRVLEETQLILKKIHRETGEMGLFISAIPALVGKKNREFGEKSIDREFDGTIRKLWKYCSTPVFLRHNGRRRIMPHENRNNTNKGIHGDPEHAIANHNHSWLNRAIGGFVKPGELLVKTYDSEGKDIRGKTMNWWHQKMPTSTHEREYKYLYIKKLSGKLHSEITNGKKLFEDLTENIKKGSKQNSLIDRLIKNMDRVKKEKYTIKGRVVIDKEGLPELLKDEKGKKLYDHTGFSSPAKKFKIGVLAQRNGAVFSILTKDIDPARSVLEREGKFDLTFYVDWAQIEKTVVLQTAEPKLKDFYFNNFSKGLVVFAEVHDTKENKIHKFYHIVDFSDSLFGRGGEGTNDRDNPRSDKLHKGLGFSGIPIEFNATHKIEENVIVPVFAQKKKPIPPPPKKEWYPKILHIDKKNKKLKGEVIEP